METTTTLQQRIEERAAQRLNEDLNKAWQLEIQVRSILGGINNYDTQLEMYRNKPWNDYTKALFDKLLPNYIEIVTDEILSKIDEIYFLANTKTVDPLDIPY